MSVANGDTGGEVMTNGEETTSADLTRTNSFNGSDADNRRESFGNRRSLTERPRKSSQRSESTTSEDDIYEQKSTAHLKAAWETKGSKSENTKSNARPKAVGGQTGASTITARFENPSSQIYQRRRSSAARTMSRSGSINEMDGETAKKVSASALKARFEQKADETAAPKRNFVINKGQTGDAAKKFNQNTSSSTKCQVCNKSVYPMEKLEVEGILFHKLCFKCETCKRTLGLGNYASLQGKFYCKPHLKQLFQLKGNYDEGFGREQRKADWVNKDGPPPKSSNPDAESGQQAVEPTQESETPNVVETKPEPEPEPEPEAESDVNGHVDETHEEQPVDEKEPEDETKSEEPVADNNDDDAAGNDESYQDEEPVAEVPAAEDEIQNGDVNDEGTGEN